ncbi:hypothetical protein GCM10009663_57430 [Kitasatospora arboriphila]|uniref:DUF3099 domain-containing protein n=1 Tax=Kitasatospora arboriphila TaxID=258052 RepID=A0ABN1TZ40_9ACTN
MSTYEFLQRMLAVGLVSLLVWLLVHLGSSPVAAVPIASGIVLIARDLWRPSRNGKPSKGSRRE